MNESLWIEWDFRPFYRRWLGWRRLFWFLWPIRWKFAVDRPGAWTRYEYHTTASEAGHAMARYAYERGIEVGAEEEIKRHA